MATITAKVKIWGQLIGAVLWDETSQTGAFEFDIAFLKNEWDVSPLMMSLKNIERDPVYQFKTLNKETFYGLPGLLSDALPDKYGTTLINAWLATQGRTPESMNPVERLCYMGKRGMGALEFEPAIHTKKETAVNIDVKSIIEVAQQILGERKKFTTKLKAGEKKGLEDIIRIGSSAGGARAKAIIAYNEKTNEVRSGQVDAPKDFSHWLMKFDGISDKNLSDPTGYGRIEMAYYKMALDCEIEMTKSMLFEENGRAHFMTKRFDRTNENEKLHVQTVCAIAHFDFSNVGAYGYEQVFQIIRKLRLSAAASEQMYRRMAFNVITRNLDDHTKNISFIMDKTGTWKLAPAYDLTWAYNPKSKWVSQHNLSINSKTKDITKNDLLTVGKEMKIKAAPAIIEDIKKTVKKWKTYAEETGIKSKQIKEVGETHLLQL